MRLHKAVHDSIGNIGVSEAGIDDALGPDFHHGINHLPVLAERHVVDVHAGKILQVLDVKLAVGRVALDGKIDEVRHVVLHVPQEPRIRAPERRHVSGIGLGDAEGRRNLVVHRHHDALAPGLAARGQCDGIDEIKRPVGTHCRCWPHGCDEDNGAVALDDKIEKVSRLFKRIRTVRDDDAVDVVLCQQLIDSVGEREQIFNAELRAADVKDLLTRDLRS